MPSTSSSSSSSSSYINSRLLYFSVINQGHGDILPFSWIVESGTEGDGSTIGFIVEANNSPDFDYRSIINRDNSSITLTSSNATSTVYVPNLEDAKYKHEKSFYVDIVAKDASGIKNIRTHVEPNGYEFEKAEDAGKVFYIPRFTWRNT